MCSVMLKTIPVVILSTNAMIEPITRKSANGSFFTFSKSVANCNGNRNNPIHYIFPLIMSVTNFVQVIIVLLVKAVFLSDMIILHTGTDIYVSSNTLCQPQPGHRAYYRQDFFYTPGKFI